MAKHNSKRVRAARLLIMPDDGMEAVKKLIDGAETRLLLKMFEFDCPAVIRSLEAAKARGVEVRVLLNPVRSNGERPNDATFAKLRDAGIETEWTSPRFVITHEKSLVVDDRVALIATFNFSPKHFTRTRDYGFVVEDPSIVDAIVQCFEADRRHETYKPSSSVPLAWGNQNAREVMCDFIDAAAHELWIQHPKFRDWAILDRVLDARARGVRVRLLCGGAHGIEERDITATFSAHRILARAGVHIKRQRHLKLHAKLLLADGKRAMLGSMNIDRDAYDVRRELGIVVETPAPVAKLHEVFEEDWDAARRYDPQDPLRLDLQTAIDAEALDPHELETVLMHD